LAGLRQSVTETSAERTKHKTSAGESALAATYERAADRAERTGQANPPQV
jgi:hypothetical protein